jgi:hypothetical protein
MSFQRPYGVTPGHTYTCRCPVCNRNMETLLERLMDEPRSPRTGETPEQILDRLAARLNCEPRQVADRVIRMLEERQNGNH